MDSNLQFYINVCNGRFENARTKDYKQSVDRLSQEVSYYEKVSGDITSDIKDDPAIVNFLATLEIMRAALERGQAYLEEAE